ncbi:RDD family protein [Catellatospora sp. TT07R-123]|uniref:RDD family protein n=1 Tax=Catellatospora sp. TT07R-123 TaxID=2733863 RepID=UPI001BB3D223|nr:RDD family protein [Catellatospora sp. TT07R-123]
MTDPGQRGADQTAQADEVPTARRRVAGWLIDYLIVVLLGVVLVVLATVFVIDNAVNTALSTAVDAGSQAVSTHHVSVGGLVVGVTWPVLVAVLLIPFLQFTYLAGMLAWGGRSVGKAVTDVRVVPVAAQLTRLRPSHVVARALLTAMLDTGIVSVAFVVFVNSPLLGVLVWAVAVVAFWGNLLAAFGRRRRTVVDLISGTRVVRTRMYAALAAGAADLARRAAEAAVTAGRQTSGLAVAAGQVTVDLGTVAGQGAREGAQAVAGSAPVQQAVARAGDAATATGQRLREGAQAVVGRESVQQTVEKTAVAASAAVQSAREGAEKLARSAPVQQALNSPAGQQAQALGAAGAQRARDVGGQAAEQARRIGGRAQQLWRERRAQRTGPVPPGADTEPDEGDEITGA